MLEKGEQQPDRTMCASIKSIMCMTSMSTHLLVCRYYKSVVICPDNQASFLYPWVVSCKNSTCTMNLRRDISPSLTAQLTVSVMNNMQVSLQWQCEVFSCGFSPGVIGWRQSQFQWQSTACYSGWITTFLHSLPRRKLMSHMQCKRSCGLTDFYRIGGGS